MSLDQLVGLLQKKQSKIILIYDLLIFVCSKEQVTGKLIIVI